MINKVILVGKLGKDPEAKSLDSGVKMTNFSVATNKNWKDKDGTKKEETTWHRITVFGTKAELAAKYLKKGSSVFIEGELKNRSYDKDGVTHYVTDIVANDIQFLGDRAQSLHKDPAKQDSKSLFE